jgi:ABC-type multidrug transport system permease subunit
MDPTLEAAADSRRVLLPATIWQREAIEFAQRRRALAIKLAFPLLIALPLVLTRAPAIYAAMGITMLITIVGALGAGAVLTRDRQSGLTLRYRTLPVTPGRLLLERLGSTATIDFIQVLPVLVLIWLRHPGSFPWWPALLIGTAAVLLIGNSMGAFASTFSDSPGEVMLYVVIPLLPLLFLSGVFMAPTGPVWLVVSRLLPFSYLHQAVLAVLGGSPDLLPWETLLGAFGFLVGAVGLTGLLGRRVLEAD